MTGIAVRDIRFDYFEHFGRGFGEFDEDAIVDLEETKELHNLAGFRGQLVDAFIRINKRFVGIYVRGEWGITP